MHDQRDNHVRTQGEDGRLQTKEGGLRRKQVCRLLDLRSPASKAGEKEKSSLPNPPSLCGILLRQP